MAEHTVEQGKEEEKEKHISIQRGSAPCFYHEEAGGTDVVMEDSTPAASMVTTGAGMVCDIKQLSASRSCWDFQPSDWQSSLLNQILSKNDRDETIAQVGSIKLQQKDFLTLGLNAALEATIANSCLDVIVMVAKEKLPGYHHLNWTHFYHFHKLTNRIAPGPWKLIKNMNVPQQLTGSVDCGIFMLMSDFPLIRKWWCLILMENFAIERKHAAVDVQEPPKAQEDTETGDMEPQMVKDLRTAVGWLRDNCHSFRGSVQEPSYLDLKKEDQEEALLKLDRAERKDDLELAKKPFMFQFQFQQDMEVFLFECHDERHLRINSMFMEF
ncbi:uncharacterized protein LOC113073303 isoform X3 [Carassius auratus]|uniref:Uncharacterized protein LOC113073303 isoform X3 n=1 Tax=Carassius auratus TaxID=7957 RepID=A0A6P6MZB0_CARAU|nr:uncharacterized protein LOC113073303 isoform X3 [Carassius auratus]